MLDLAATSDLSLLSSWERDSEVQLIRSQLGGPSERIRFERLTRHLVESLRSLPFFPPISIKARPIQLTHDSPSRSKDFLRECRGRLRNSRAVIKHAQQMTRHQRDIDILTATICPRGVRRTRRHAGDVSAIVADSGVTRNLVSHPVTQLSTPRVAIASTTNGERRRRGRGRAISRDVA